MTVVNAISEPKKHNKYQYISVRMIANQVLWHISSFFSFKFPENATTPPHPPDNVLPSDHINCNIYVVRNVHVIIVMAAMSYCPISTATTHIGSSCACSGGESRFGLVLVDGLGQSKAVPVGHPKPIIPLFRAIVTVMAKILYIQPIAISS